MSGTEGLRRRRFLQVAASGAAVTVSCGGPGNQFRFLTNAEAVTLAALCDQIIPPDHDPGAFQAGVVDYIDRQLSGFHRKFRKEYRTGLAVLDELARARHGDIFARLGFDRQLALLEAVEGGKAGDALLRNFFSTAVRHSMEGFYGSPRHGGNRNWASWRMLGVPPAPVRGRQHFDRSST